MKSVNKTTAIRCIPRWAFSSGYSYPPPLFSLLKMFSRRTPFPPQTHTCKVTMETAMRNVTLPKKNHAPQSLWGFETPEALHVASLFALPHSFFIFGCVTNHRKTNRIDNLQLFAPKWSAIEREERREEGETTFVISFYDIQKQKCAGLIRIARRRSSGIDERIDVGG